MRDLSTLRSCVAVTDRDIEDALAPSPSPADPSPRDRTLALVRRMAEIAKPRAGAPKILMVLGKMATQDWMKGELVVRLNAAGDSTQLELMADEGAPASTREAPLTINAPLQEFGNALDRRPDLILPLQVEGRFGPQEAVLRMTEARRRTTQPPPLSAVSDELLHAVIDGSLPSPPLPLVHSDAPHAQARGPKSSPPVPSSPPKPAYSELPASLAQFDSEPPDEKPK